MSAPSFDGRRRVIIEGVSPTVDDGRFPAKRVTGEIALIEADIFADGHDVLSAVMLHRHQSDSKHRETRMTPLVNDRWRAELPIEKLGHYFFTIEGWVDHFLTWLRDLKKRPECQSKTTESLTRGRESKYATKRLADRSGRNTAVD